MINGITYNQFPKLMAEAIINWETDEHKIALVRNSYALSQDDVSFAQDVAADEASGNGYTAGGIALANKTLTNAGMFADDAAFGVISVSYRYAVLYRNGAIGGYDSPLLAYWDIAGISGEITLSLTDYQLDVANDGVIAFV